MSTSFAPAERGKLRELTPNVKVSKKGSTLSAQEQYIFYISGVVAFLLIVFTCCQTANSFSPAFTEPATSSSCQDNSF